METETAAPVKSRRSKPTVEPPYGHEWLAGKLVRTKFYLPENNPKLQEEPPTEEEDLALDFRDNDPWLNDDYGGRQSSNLILVSETDDFIRTGDRIIHRHRVHYRQVS